MKINLIINLKDKDSSLSFYQYYPRLFKAYFPKVNEIIIEELSDAGYLYFQSTLALDQLIDNKNIQKIFEPFYTTKTRGTGLGLAITKQIIDQHQGEIHIESTVGSGTHVSVVLPITREEI